MRTNVKILQHIRLDAKVVVSVKRWKQTKKYTNILEGSNRNFRNAGFFYGRRQLKAQEFFMP